MGHGIMNSDTMFSVGQKPWHGLGTVVEQAPNMEQALQLAGLDWPVKLQPLFIGDPATAWDHDQKTVGIGGKEEFFKMGQKAPAYATINGKTGSLLGVVGERYTPLQNVDAFRFFDPFVQAGLATFETAGSLFDGQKIWVMCKIKCDNAQIVPGDEIEAYTLLSSSHDGTSAVRVGFTPQRVVCNNTLQMAHGNKASKLIKVKHGKNVVTNLDNLRDTMNLITSSFEATADQYRFLSGRQINQSDLKRYIKIVFSQEKVEDIDFNNDKDSRLDRDITELFEYGRGATMPGVRGTYWGAYNAVSEYLTHYRGRSAEQRVNSLWFADGNRLNQRALETALVGV